MTESMTRMSRSDCLARLAEGTVGRVAHACDGNVVAFEVDDVARDGSGGWSVLVVGVAGLLAGSEALRAFELNLASAIGDDRDQFVRIDIGRMTGRRTGTAVVPTRFPTQASTYPSAAS